MNQYRLPTNRPTTHPGEMLWEEFLKHPESLALVACITGTSVEFWLNLQRTWDEWVQQQEKGGPDDPSRMSGIASSEPCSDGATGRHAPLPVENRDSGTSSPAAFTKEAP